jgi:hypothetical protein
LITSRQVQGYWEFKNGVHSFGRRTRRKTPAVKTAFERYSNYLQQNEAAFPASAYELATSDWFYNPRDHRCPHDAWLESLQILEKPDTGPRQRSFSISLRLLGAYHDGHIEIAYPKVYAYSFQNPSPNANSHGDWRYDEFRISDRGHLVHEIEWAYGAQRRAFAWTIEADDIDFRWKPK